MWLSAFTCGEQAALADNLRALHRGAARGNTQPLVLQSQRYVIERTRIVLDHDARCQTLEQRCQAGRGEAKFTKLAEGFMFDPRSMSNGFVDVFPKSPSASLLCRAQARAQPHLMCH